MNNNLVTVFIPAYNAEMYISECLNSIVNQTYKNLEILIIDDGSTDDTVKIIETFNDRRIKLIKNNYNRGLPYTRNLGLKESSGDYIAIMDADDISNVNRIEKQVRAMDTNENIDVLISQARVFGGKFKRLWKPPVDSELIKISLLFGNRICNSTAIIRKSSLTKFNIKYNEECFVAQDYEMWCQISKVGNIDTTNEPLVDYRFGHENITKKSKDNKDRYIKRRNVLDKIHNNLLDFYKFNLTDEEKITYNTFFDDNPINKINKENIIGIKLILNKILHNNINNLVFNQDKLVEVMDISVIKQISEHKINLVGKINMYLNLTINKFKVRNINELLKMCIKHFINI